MAITSHGALQITLKEAVKLTNQIALSDVVKFHAKRKSYSFTLLSRRLDVNHNFVKLAVKQPPKIHLLLALSGHLDINLIQPYERFLPEHLQSTSKEILLQQEIDRLNVELAKTKEILEVVKDFARKG